MLTAVIPREADMKWSAVITACGTSLLLLALTTQAAHAARPIDLKAQVDAYRAQHESAIVARLDELARFKSVAADPAGIAAAADRLEALLKERGFDALQLSAGTGTPPIVFGTLKVANAKRSEEHTS